MASKDPAARALLGRAAQGNLTASFSAAASGPKPAPLTPTFNAAAQTRPQTKLAAPQPVLAPPGLQAGGPSVGHAASQTRKRQAMQAAAQNAKTAPTQARARTLGQQASLTPAFNRAKQR